MVIKEFQEQMHKVIHRHESANTVRLNGRRLGGNNIWPGKIPDDPRESHVTINPSDY